LSLGADPPALLLAPAVALAIAVAVALRPTRGAFPALLLAAAALGAAAAEVSVRRAAQPKIERPVYSRAVAGHVLRVDPRAERAPRALLAVASVEGLAPEATPARLMLVGRNLGDVAVGAPIRVGARLAPSPLPTHPGAYDPSFVGYFEGFGGYGFVAGRPAAAELPPPSPRDRVSIAVTAWRTAITQRIVERLGPQTGPIAAALVTGQRTAIQEDMLQAFNASGLLHVLSISGLHMALVAGGLFWLFRALLAAVPPITLRWPVKKAAAVLALGMATFYLVASGAEVATTRAYVMISVMFIAILADRPALTMRNLVLAAALIILVMPESLRSASFQMSFFATAALVAAIERGLVPQLASREQPWRVRFVAAVAQAVLVTAVVSLVCELAILPIALHHFHRVVWFGLVGNVLALAVVDFLIMPAALVALILLPLGWGDWVIPVLGFGVDRMIEIARFVGGLPGAMTPVQGLGLLPLLLCLGGILWACLWRTPIALAGLAPYLLGFAIWGFERPPDLRVSGSGELVAVRGADGRLVLDAVARDDFVARRWLEAEGDRRAPNDASLTRARRCDASGCTVEMRGGLVVALPRDPAAFAEDCARADILVTRLAAPPHCPRPRLVLDRAAIGRAHGLAAFVGPNSVRLASHAASCGARAWCPDPERPRSRRPFGRARAPAQ
jgi:competence protein ComEC